MAGLAIELQGERIRLLPERALFWERTRTLLVADAHLGKAATFRAAGIPAPGGATTDDLARLSAALVATHAERLIFLGDLFHARQGKVPRTLDSLAAWRAHHAKLEITLVRGNHDRHAGDPPPELAICCVDPPLAAPPFVFLHLPEPSDAEYVLAGHFHPAATLVGHGRQRERLPCFWFGDRVGVLPAFGTFTGRADVHPQPGDRVFVVAGDEIVDVTR